MTITRMLGLRQMLGRPVTRRSAVVAAGAPLAALFPADVATSSHAGHAECHDAHADTLLALSELQGQVARLQSRCLALAQQLEARYQRYSWTEALAADLRAIAHDTPTEAQR